ncbi:MAG: OadG family protein [Rhodospirillales bacterium]|nr:OadG family protein [Rhodospirillales bacterium]
MEHVELILSGFGIVMGVLTMLWGVTAAVAVGAKSPAKPKDKGPAKPVVAPPAQTGTQNSASAGVPANHLALIAAAVAAAFDTPHRIVSVHGPRAHVSAWTQQGLFEHFASHRMPWHNAVPHGRRTKS